MKKIFLAVAFSLLASGIQAQTNGSSSSYSRFGLGTLNDQSQGFNRGMAGVGIGIQLGNRVNMANPASYAVIDSLSFLFDVGMNVSLGRLSMTGTSKNVQNCSLDYVNAGLQLRRGLGLSFGFVPFSTIGYNFSNQRKVGTDLSTLQTITSTSTYKGDGGLHQAYVGMGWQPFKPFSVGANIAFLWGEYSHSLKQTSSASGTSDQNLTHSANLRTYKIDLGAQYVLPLAKGDRLTLGATAGIGHRIGSDVTLTHYSSAGDSTVSVAKHPFDLPYTFGIGASWTHKGLLVAADVRQEQWANCHAPEEVKSGTTIIYRAHKNAYLNRTKISAGAQYLPDAFDNHYIKRMQYRAGVSYSTPYLKVNGQNGPSELSLTAGVGLPIANRYNNRSMVNVNVQWFRRAASQAGMIKENYFMLNVGMTFNERWFMKSRIQ